MMDSLLAPLAAFSDQPLERALIDQLHALAQRQHFSIETLAMTTDFPAYLHDLYRADQFNHIAAALPLSAFWWISVANQENGIDFAQAVGLTSYDGLSASISSGSDGCLIACNSLFLNTNIDSFIETALQNNWQFQPVGNI